MPEKRLAEARKGYEDYVYQPPRVQPVIVTDEGFTANVIEGDHFETGRDPGDETPWGV